MCLFARRDGKITHKNIYQQNIFLHVNIISLLCLTKISHTHFKLSVLAARNNILHDVSRTQKISEVFFNEGVKELRFLFILFFFFLIDNKNRTKITHKKPIKSDFAGEQNINNENTTLH